MMWNILPKIFSDHNEASYLWEFPNGLVGLGWCAERRFRVVVIFRATSRQGPIELVYSRQWRVPRVNSL